MHCPARRAQPPHHTSLHIASRSQVTTLRRLIDPRSYVSNLEYFASVTMLKQPNEIERWQAGAGAEADVDDIGIVARLLRACIDSISHLLHRTDCSQYGLRRCLAILKLWAHGHGAWSGKLDNILERSRNLLHIALSILNPLCKVLYNGM
jgi:hypothetical protein